MAFKRTQIYVKPEQHRQLKREAEEQGISLAELLRRIIRDYLRRGRSREDFDRIVALGKSGRADVARDHDRYLAEALGEDERADEDLR